MADEEKPMEEQRDDEEKTIPMKREPKPACAPDGSVGGSGGFGGGVSSYTAGGNEKIPPNRK
jgi:hypothetical protein